MGYYTFPTLKNFAARDENFYRGLGLGYRAKYIAETSKRLYNEGFSALENKSGRELKNALVKYMGIGNKVADCISLFAFHDTAAFPVDTWIEKLYHENFGGKETNREKINEHFMNTFGTHAGIFQQYLFYYKRENPAFEK
jgi:N-glycosylase/DNA lyase